MARLDARLQLAASLVPPCHLVADIGTDHGLLPIALMEAGHCEKAIFSDISPHALRHAEKNVQQAGLTQRAAFTVADGLRGLEEACGCICILGMGGQTMAEILRRDQNRLRGAALVLSAHTDQPLVRRTVQEIGYHLTQERLCQAEGYWYVLWQAQPGRVSLSDDACRLGEGLYREESTLLADYLRWRLRVWERKRAGLERGSRRTEAGEALLRQLRADIAHDQHILEALPCGQSERR